MKKKETPKIIKIIGDVANSFAREATPDGWPPPCSSLLYQPKRPDAVVKAASIKK